MRRLLGRILLLGMLAVSPLFGAKMSQEEIEKIMNLMHRTEIVQVMEKDGGPPR
jgi:hypothetical protein